VAELNGGTAATSFAGARQNLEVTRRHLIKGIAKAEPGTPAAAPFNAPPIAGEIYLQDDNVAHASGSASWIAIGENGLGEWDGVAAWVPVAVAAEDIAYSTFYATQYQYAGTDSLKGVWSFSKWVAISGYPRLANADTGPISGVRLMLAEEAGTLFEVAGGSVVTLPESSGPNGVPGLTYAFHARALGAAITFNVTNGQTILDGSQVGFVTPTSLVVPDGTQRFVIFYGGNNAGGPGYSVP
jgi:hypothetical protein